MKKNKLTEYEKMAFDSETGFRFMSGTNRKEDCIVELRRSLRKVHNMLDRMEPEKQNWQHEFFEMLYQMNKSCEKVKESIGHYLKANRKNIKKYVVEVVSKREHELSPKYFSDSGSKKYNDAMQLVIIGLVNEGILAVDIHWKLCLGSQKLPD